MVLTTIIRLSGAKRVPLIKFRKGGYQYAGAAANQASASQSAMPGYKATSAKEDWELPPRYWRKQIDVEEMEYINRGGPA